MRWSGLPTWIAGLLFAALVPALLLLAVGGGPWRLLPYFHIVVAAHVLLLGLPVAALAEWRGWKSPLVAILAGALIGGLPLTIALLLSPSGGTSVWSDNTPTMVDGVRTWAGWLELLKFGGTFAAFGAAGALTFWLTLRLVGPWAPVPVQRPRAGLALAAIAIAATAAVYWWPEETRDRSCHNLFRNGEQSASPKFTVDIDLPPQRWPEVEAFLQKFAEAHGQSVRLSARQPDSFGQSMFSACSDAVDGVINAYTPLAGLGLPQRGITVVVFDQRAGLQWRKLALELVAALEAEYQDKVRFRGTEGQLIPKPDILKP